VEEQTALSALDNVTQGKFILEESENGSFITSILNVSDDSGQYSWMYTVNDETPWVSADKCEVNALDEIVFYFINWQETEYAFFDRAYVETAVGGDISFNLLSLDFEGNLTPVDNAQIIITSDSPLPRIQHYTDENGIVTLSFGYPGVYEITARKGDGISAISRPYAQILVTEEAHGPIGMTPAPLSYAPDNGDLYISGQLVPMPEDSRSIFDDAYDELFIPLRALAEAIGMDVSWAADTATVTVLYMGNTHTFTTSDTFSGMPIKIINNRVYIPSLYFIVVILRG
jgi:hypothetical protein